MTYQEYLTAKRTVDDRALDRRVLEQFATELGERAEELDRPVEIIEAGAGTGTMVARLVEWDLLPDRVEYTGIDRNEQNVECARTQVPQWIRSAGYDIEQTERGFRVRTASRTLDGRFETGDVFERSGTADAVIACSFCDLMEPRSGVTQLHALLEPDGLLYAPITYDGLTRFVPTHEFDGEIESLYHEHMATVRPDPGGPHAGRRLLEAVDESDATLLATGGSDWILRPAAGAYPAEERLVLEKLLDTITGSVREVPDTPLARLAEWERQRSEQLDDARLTYLAHNLDLLARACRQK